MTDEARFSLKKKFGGPIQAKWAKIGPATRFFLPFSQVWFINFQIAYNESLEQCITTSRDKTLKKLGVQN